MLINEDPHYSLLKEREVLGFDQGKTGTPSRKLVQSYKSIFDLIKEPFFLWVNLPNRALSLEGFAHLSFRPVGVTVMMYILFHAFRRKLGAPFHGGGISLPVLGSFGNDQIDISVTGLAHGPYLQELLVKFRV